MTKDTMTIVVFFGYTLLAMAAGAVVYHMILGHEVRQIDEGVAHEQTMDDGSVLLHRDPGGRLDVPEPERPVGHQPVRSVEVEVLPPPVTVQAGACPRTVTCPPVSVRLDLLQAEDGTYRAQASSKDGTVLSGIDVPRAPVLALEQRPWAAGVSYDGDRTAVFLHRDVGRLRVGVDSDGESTRASVGWRW